jgi:hypothetical protein
VGGDKGVVRNDILATMNNMKIKHIGVLIIGALFLVPVVGKAAINLHWDNADDNIVKTDIYRTVTGSLSTPDSQYFIASVYVPTTSFRDNSVNSGVKYYYTLFNFDDNGVMSDPGNVFFTDEDGMIEDKQPVEEKPAKETENNGARTTTRVNVRSNPGLTAAIIRVAEACSRGTLTGESATSGGREWVKVMFNTGGAGWVAKQYVTEETTTVVQSTLTDTERAEKIRQIQVLLADLISKLITLLKAQQGN